MGSLSRSLTISPLKEDFSQWNFDIESLPAGKTIKEILQSACNRGAEVAVQEIRDSAGWFLLREPDRIVVQLWEGFYLSIPVDELVEELGKLK